MAVANTSKSLVHIQEKFVKRGPITAALPTITAAGTYTVTVTGAKVGDWVIAQPATSSDIAGTAAISNAYVSAADTVTIVVVGTGTLSSKNYIFTLFARPFA